MTTRPDPVWPEVWTKIGKAAQNLEKQGWAKEKPKLDNARKLRGIYFVDLDDEAYKEILKNARRKLERPVAPGMPCKRSPNGITKVVAKLEIASEKTPKTVHECIVESHESTRQRAESSQTENLEDHMASKRITSMSHHNVVRKFIPMPQAMKVPEAKAAVDKEWKKLETIPAWQFWKHKETKRKSTLQH